MEETLAIYWSMLHNFLFPDLLIIDYFELTALTLSQEEDFYEIITERHLKSSMIVTSNRPPQDLGGSPVP